MLRASRAAAVALHARLACDERFAVGRCPDLDVVVWAVIAANASETSECARRVLAECARRDVHLSLTQLPPGCLGIPDTPTAGDDGLVTCLRACLVKPEHREWVDRIFDIVSEATNAVTGTRATISGSARAAHASSNRAAGHGARASAQPD
jgi:tyrosine decarboxylase / aspartate 1-decarboxylase